MKWLKRCSWLFAWGVWLWLGVGLYRELPRQLGSAVRQLPLTATSKVLGFVGDSDSVAVLTTANPNGVFTKVRVIDASTGSTKTEWLGPMWKNENEWTPDLIKRGFLFELRTDGVKSISDGGLHVLDLATGEWRPLSIARVEAVSLHSSKPWSAIVQSVGRRADRVIVVDYQTGQELFRWDVPTHGSLRGRPLFIEDQDALVVAYAARRERGEDTTTEIWRLADPPVLLKTLNGLPSAGRASISRNGRVLFGGFGRLSWGQFWTDVYDLNEERFLPLAPADKLDWVQGRRTHNGSARITPGGDHVLRGSPPSLVEIGTGRVLWRPQCPESVVTSTSGSLFHVEENWTALWRDLRKSPTFRTVAHRDLETGELVMRTMDRIVVDDANTNAKGTLLVLPDGAVHRLPLPRNWMLFFICQSLLATPIVLLWFVLRWRRRSRLTFVASQ